MVNKFKKRLVIGDQTKIPEVYREIPVYVDVNSDLKITRSEQFYLATFSNRDTYYTVFLIKNTKEYEVVDIAMGSLASTDLSGYIRKLVKENLK